MGLTLGHDCARAIAQACWAIRSRQSADGSFRDYDLPVGPSDAWVTAYVGLALTECGRILGCEATLAAGRRAAEALLLGRSSRPGWGYNSAVAPDADSTAQAIRLLRAHALPVPTEAHNFLLAHRQTDGGYGTYLAQSGWGRSHPDVTAIVALALSPSEFLRQQESLGAYFRALCRADGTWPSYWWSSAWYATSAILDLLRLHPELARGYGAHDDFVARPQNLMEAAWLLRSLSTMPGLASRTLPLVTRLLSLQNEAGLWPPSRTLRVTEDTCTSADENSPGDLYADENGLMTASTVCLGLVRYVDSVSQ